MDLLTVIGACSVARDFTIVLAMAATFSQGNEFTVKDSVELENPPLFDPVYGASMGGDDRSNAEPRSRDVALSKLKRLRSAGRTPLVGILPVPLGWAETFHRRATELFDPCVNISVGSAMIAQFEYECGRKGGRACVVERYSKAAGIDAFGERLLEAVETNGYPEPGDVALESDTVYSNSIYPTRSAGREWGADKIFFKTLGSE